MIPPLRIFATLVGVATAIGLVEAAALGLLHLRTDELVWVGPRMAWMAPAAYGMLAVVPAGLLASGAGLWPRLARVGLALGLGGLAAIGTVTALRILTEQRLHIAAMALAGAGLGFQLARAVLRNPSSAARQSGRLAVGTVALTALLAGLVEGRAALREASGARVTASATPPAGTPNILLLILDTVRAEQLGLYGHGRPTSPVLDSLAGRAVVFQNAFATSSWTLPSHASMFTGRFPHEVEAGWRWALEPGVPTVAEVLREAGYHTGGFVANLYYTTGETGLGRGFTRYEDYPLNRKEFLLSTELAQLLSRTHGRIILREHARKRSNRLIQDFLGWQERLDPDRPFFAFLNLFDAHIPRYAPDSIRRAFAGSTRTPDEDRYSAAIAYMDREIGRLLAELRRRGALERTVVIIASDHGEQFGRKGLYDHGNSLYTTVVRVPLLILLPGEAGAGRRITQPVSLRNLARTILEVAGRGDYRSIPGTSFARFWRAPDPASEPQDSPVLAELTPSPRVPASHRNARGEIRSLVRGRWHIIGNGDRSMELFDYWADPQERNNLVGQPVTGRRAVDSMLVRLRILDSLFPREPAPSGP